MRINKKRMEALSITDLDSLITISDEHIGEYGDGDERCKGWKHLKTSCKSALSGRINSLYIDEKGIRQNSKFLLV